MIAAIAIHSDPDQLHTHSPRIQHLPCRSQHFRKPILYRLDVKLFVLDDIRHGLQRLALIPEDLSHPIST